MESLLQFSLQDGSVSSDCSESVQYYTGGKMDSLLRVGFAGQLSTFHVHDTIKSASTPTHRGTVPTSCTAFLNSSDSLMLVLPPRSSYRNKMTIIIQTNLMHI